MAAKTVPKTKRQRTLEKHLKEAQQTLDELLASADPSLVETQKNAAGLSARLWELRREIAVEISYNPKVTDSTVKGRAANDAVDFDRRHHEAQTMFGRLVDKLKADLLPKVLAKLEEIQGTEENFRAVVARRAGAR